MRNFNSKIRVSTTKMLHALISS